MSFYASTSAAGLATDILLQCGKLYANKYELDIVTGTMGTPGATAEITLTGQTFVNDYFNDMTLYIQDDTGVLCSVNIDDSTADTPITVDTTACDKVSDESTAGAWTASGTYQMYILGDEEFVGYSTQSLDYEEEIVEFLDCNEKVRDDITKVVMGWSGDAKNFSSDKTFANIFNLTQYGSQTNQKQYHGGFTPGAKTYYHVTAKADNVADKEISISLFKGQFFNNGAIDMSAAGEYKIVPYSFKAVKDSLRDSGAVNGWSITEET